MSDSAIRRLVHRYALAFDAADRESFEELWAPEGVLEVFEDGPSRPRTGRLRAGRDFHHAFERLAAYERTLHHVTTHDVHVDGDTAIGVTYCEAHHVAGEQDLVMHIRYEDRFALGPTGWRFAHRRVLVLGREVRGGTWSSSPGTP